jgi:glycerate-2-kinase
MKDKRKVLERIFFAGLHAVDPEQAVHKHLKRFGAELRVEERSYHLDRFRRIILVGAGKGGRNQELALASAIALDGWDGIALLSGGTDGTDGPTDAAGAFADGSTCREALEAGMDPFDFLSRNDAYPLFDSLGNLLKTGPTRTNVMDMICLLVEKTNPTY